MHHATSFLFFDGNVHVEISQSAREQMLVGGDRKSKKGGARRNRSVLSWMQKNIYTKTNRYIGKEHVCMKKERREDMGGGLEGK